MKIILLKDVKKLGKMHEVKDVKTGYGRNFLIPSGIAKVANKSNLRWLELIKLQSDNLRQTKEKLAKEKASALEKIKLKIELRTDKDNNVFGVVNQRIIISELKKLGFDLDKNQIDTQFKIKELGEFEVPVDLGYGVETKIKIITSPKK